jgi:hypothetical protein
MSSNQSRMSDSAHDGSACLMREPSHRIAPRMAMRYARRMYGSFFSSQSRIWREV